MSKKAEFSHLRIKKQENKLDDKTKKETRKRQIINSVLLIFTLALIYEIVRDSLRPSDFDGYVRAGNAVLNQTDIYADHLNTWPPLFSVFSVILAWFDGVSVFMTRFLWNLGSLLAMLGSIQLTVSICTNETIQLMRKRTASLLRNPIVLVPLVIMLRYILDNMANVQINIYMLFCSLFTIYLFIHKKYAWAGLLLGLTISLKVYTVFFLFYFIFKREYRIVTWTFLALVGLNLISFGVYGYEGAIANYHHWLSIGTEQAYTAIHRNQSIFAMFFRYLTTEDPEQGLYVNFMSLDPLKVRSMVYGVIVMIGLLPVVLFRKKLKNPSSFQAIMEYSIVFTVVPILTPISWKAYFIFLWVPYFLMFLVLFKNKPTVKPGALVRMKVLFFGSILLTVFSTELVVGNYFSDVLEAYSVITIGTIMLLILQFMVLIKQDAFSMKIE
ncbi:MAG: DUF2029 domain-containing protein [Crocinitomix sp.]|nr:DUF2029 domain-containing protein [Crocinitomix sp.]